MNYKVLEYENSNGYELKMWKVKANSDHIPTYNHQHANFEISTVISGYGKYQTNNKCYDIAPGDVFVFSSYETHYIKEIGDMGLKMLNLHFSPTFILSKSFIGLSTANANFPFSHSKSFNNRIQSENANQISNELKEIYKELSEKPIEYKLAVKTHLSNILLDLIRNKGYSNNENSLQKSSIKKLSGVIAYIDSNFTEQLKIEELSAMSGMTDNYFSTLFKKIYNVSPKEYIILKRLEFATNILVSEGDRKVLDVAVSSGFNNTANFNKLFKKYYGVTPKEYKKQTI